MATVRPTIVNPFAKLASLHLSPPSSPDLSLWAVSCILILSSARLIFEREKAEMLP